jgi:uncharacterized protein (DUF779 family)
VLVFTIGTGCCKSAAPFLYENFWPGPDQEIVGDVAGVPVYAPALLRALYPGVDGVVIDIEEGALVESFSIETEYGSRFVLRGSGPDARRGEEPSWPAPPREVPSAVSALRPLGTPKLPTGLVELRKLRRRQGNARQRQVPRSSGCSRARRDLRHCRDFRFLRDGSVMRPSAVHAGRPRQGVVSWPR